MTSDQKLMLLRPALVALGFDVEGGKKAADKLRRPVLLGEMGAEERAYEVDAFHGEWGVALEVEARRGTQGNAIYRDLIPTSLLIDARFWRSPCASNTALSPAGRPSRHRTSAKRSACSTRSTQATVYDFP